MQYLIFTSRPTAEAHQTMVNSLAGYPEPLESLHQVGLGPHAPRELGQAMNYAEILVDQTGTRFALPLSEFVAAPEGCEIVDALPEDWYPPMEIP